MDSRDAVLGSSHLGRSAGLCRGCGIERKTFVAPLDGGSASDCPHAGVASLALRRPVVADRDQSSHCGSESSCAFVEATEIGIAWADLEQEILSAVSSVPNESEIWMKQ